MVYFTTNLSEVTARPSILLSGDRWDDDDAVDRVPFSRPCQTPTTGIPIADSCRAYLSNLSVGLSQWIALVTSGDTLDRLRGHRSNPVTFITFPTAQLPPWTKTTAVRLKL